MSKCKNSERVMETGDHRLLSVAEVKNGASPKSHKSRGNFLNYLTIAVIAVAATFTSCKKDETNLKEFTVTFESNGGSSVEAKIVKEGEKVTKPSPDPTKDENTFAAWFKEAGFATEWNFDADMVRANVTLYAKWIQNEPTDLSLNRFQAKSYEGNDNIKYSYSYEGFDLYYIYLGELLNIPMFSFSHQRHGFGQATSTYTVTITNEIRNSVEETVSNSSQTVLTTADEHTVSKTTGGSISVEIGGNIPIINVGAKARAEEHWEDFWKNTTSTEFQLTTSLTNTVTHATSHALTTMEARAFNLTGDMKAGYYRYTMFAVSDVYLFVIRNTDTEKIYYEFKEHVIPGAYFWDLDFSESATFGKTDATNFELDLSILDNLPTTMWDFGASEPATLTTNAVTITTTTATLGGNITYEGEPAYFERGMVYATTQNPTTDDNKILVAGTGTGDFTVNVAGLTPNTRYYVRAYAINTENPVYGTQVNFITTPTGIWTQKADFAGGIRSGAVGFSIGSKGYIGTGYGRLDYQQDFWEYDPVSNSWTQKSDFAGGIRHGAVGFSIGNKGYIGTGTTTNSTLDGKNDFWEYDPVSNSWTQKANCTDRSVRKDVGYTNAVGFSIGNKGYVGTGADNTNGTQRAWFSEYDPVSNSWTSKADYGGGITAFSVGFSIGNKGYIGIGSGTGNGSRSFWEYDPDTNTWTRKADFAGSVRRGEVGFSIGNKGYVGTGIDWSSNYYQDFWEFTP